MTAEEKKQLAEQFETFPTGVVSDAMDALGLPKGVIAGLVPLGGRQKRTAGFAVTIRQIRRRTPYDGTNLAKQGAVIDGVLGEDDVLVIDMGDIRDASTGGDLLALRAQMKGARGELVNGCLRDVEDIEELGFPVWFAGPNPRKSAYDVETAGVNVPLDLGGVPVRPGDLIVMDRTGVLCVPAEQADAVARKCAEIAANDERVSAGLRAGLSLRDARRAARGA